MLLRMDEVCEVQTNLIWKIIRKIEQLFFS